MSDSPWANWNGEEQLLDSVHVPATDRGFLFGDAIYEVLRVYHGQPFLFEQHLARLEKNLRQLRINSDAAVIRQRITALLQRSQVQDGVVYIQVTRGSAPRTHRFPEPAVRPNELIWVAPQGDPYAALRTIGGKAITTRDLRWKRCDIKSVNLLANVLAAEDAHAAGCVEALFTDDTGRLIEGSRTSLFGVRSGEILTAPLGSNLLPGITRQLLTELAATAGITLREEALRVEHLSDLDELFLTGTTTEILPLIQVDDVTIGKGQPGPVTQRLQAEYRRVVDRLK